MFCTNCKNFTASIKVRIELGTTFYTCGEKPITAKSEVGDCDKFTPKDFIYCHKHLCRMSWDICYYRAYKLKCGKRCKTFKILINNAICLEKAHKGIIRIFLENIQGDKK